MNSFVVAAIAFVCLGGASMAALFLTPFMPAAWRDDATTTVIRQIASIFAIMTSLVFGFTLNSAASAYATIDANVHSYATNLIILDHSMRSFGPGAEPARLLLIDYVGEAIDNPARADRSPADADTAGDALNALGEAIAAITAEDEDHTLRLAGLRQQYQRIVEQRWAIVEQSERNIPAPLIAMLVCWLTLIFATFGYRAPRNAAIIALLLVAAAVNASSLYLILDMDVPFSGPIQISDVPLQRALTEMML